jgi:alkylresorcinol/alkylpyrone synthase
VSWILGSGILLPPHQYSQAELADALVELWGDELYNPDRLRAFFESVQVQGRALALPKERYGELRGDFGARNLAWREVALDLLSRLTPQVAEQAGIPLETVDFLVSTTVTGLAVPTLEARLMNRLPFSRNARRVPLFGLGCLAGAAGVARLHDLLGDSSHCGLLLAVELCSLTLRTSDLSVANLISTGLFGDGAGVVAMCGGQHPLARQAAHSGKACRVVETRSVFFDDSEYVMGWEFDDQGFQIVLASDVPTYAAGPVCQGLLSFLQEHELTPDKVTHWLAHPGGPKVMQALEESLGVPGALDSSRRSLAETGNLSSVSVLCLLDELLASGRARPGDWGVLMAMGPAFCAEIVLLRWQ